MSLVSDTAFRAFLSIITGGAAGAWLVHDVVFLARLRGKRRDPLVGDQRFGYVMGIVIGAVGVFGTLRYNGIL